MKSDVPEWIDRRYDILWAAFGDKTFRFEDAAKVLMDKNKDAWEQVPVFLSQLRKAGFLLVESDVHDARQKLYRLQSRTEKIAEKLGRGDIDALLKRAADLIRTRVDYKFILILLFMKRISDKWEIEYEEAYKEALADGLSEEDAKAEAKRDEYHLFNLPEEYLWENLRKNVSGLTEQFSKALKAIAERNPELKDVVDSVDFVQFASSRENAETLRQLVELFSEKKLNHVSADVLGDAYEWILRYFAPTKAKEGEIYTPREVIKLLVEILDPKPMESVYDPACGSGGMLIEAFKHVEEKHTFEEAQKLFLFGQEVNQRTIALAKMNMYIHDIRDAHLEFGDTFLYPKFKEGEGTKQFDVVLANPPWNQDGYSEEVLKKGEFWKQRFSFGFVPRQNADWAWIEHMLASAKDNGGRVGIVIDSGCLFRGGKEKAIRSAIINEKNDLVECVILLPEKLFYNTPAPGVIIVFNLHKAADRKSKVLFINASQEAQEHAEVRKLNRLGESNIKKIADAYKNFTEEDGFSRIVPLESIEQNNGNMNVPLYVIQNQQSEEIDVEGEFEKLKILEEQRQETAKKLEQYIRELMCANNSIGQPAKEWDLVELRQLVLDVRNGFASGKRDENGIAQIRMNNLTTDGRLILDSYIKVPIPDAVSTWLLKPNDFLFNNTNSIELVGKSAIFRGAPFPCTFSNHFTRLRFNENMVLPDFVLYHFISLWKKGYFRSVAIRHVGQAAVHTEYVLKLRIALPPMEEQKKIVEILSSTNRELELERQESGKLERIRAGLMNSLLSGEIRAKTD